MIVNRIIDNAAVAIASVNRLRPRSPPAAWRWATPRKGGATVFGVAGEQARQP